MHLDLKRKWSLFQRQVWGTTELGRFDVSKAKLVGRDAEILARDVILPGLGFSEIDDFSGHSNQFFVDFVATFQGERVLVDATIKLKAYVPDKSFIASALRMKLFILHVSPVRSDLYFLHELVPGRSVIRVPAAFIREKHKLITQGAVSEDA